VSLPERRHGRNANLWWQMTTGGLHPPGWAATLHLQPVLPGWLFPKMGVALLFWERVTYVNPGLPILLAPAPQAQQITLVDPQGQRTMLPGANSIPLCRSRAVLGSMRKFYGVRLGRESKFKCRLLLKGRGL
jgi:hypothetical protein